MELSCKQNCGRLWLFSFENMHDGVPVKVKLLAASFVKYLKNSEESKDV